MSFKVVALDNFFQWKIVFFKWEVVSSSWFGHTVYIAVVLKQTFLMCLSHNIIVCERVLPVYDQISWKFTHAISSSWKILQDSVYFYTPNHLFSCWFQTWDRIPLQIRGISLCLKILKLVEVGLLRPQLGKRTSKPINFLWIAIFYNM